MKRLRLGTRSSALALNQSKIVAAKMEALGELKVEIVEFRTSGDKKQKLPESTPRDKKDWIFEIEEGLLSGQIDFAVHSGKDVPIDIADGTDVLPVLPRKSPEDILILADRAQKASGADTFSFLAEGAKVGTASLRRKAQLLYRRPDLEVVPIRGNVPTRIQKMEEEAYCDALILANSGVLRLDITTINSKVFSVEEFLPAVSQGQLCVQFASSAEDVQKQLKPLVEKPCQLAWTIERSFVEKMGADCRSALGVYAEVVDNNLKVSARVFAADGSQCIEKSKVVDLEDAQLVGKLLAEEVIEAGGLKLLEGE